MTAIADLPDIRPSLLLDFANSGCVDPRIECTRASAATCFGPDGKLRVVPANTPRIDYDPVTGKCLGLLVEESRTNLIPNSGNFTNGWNYGRVFLGPSKVSPTGLTGVKVIESVSANSETHVIGVTVNVAAGQQVTVSFIVEAGERSRCSLRCASPGYIGRVFFDLSAASVVSVDGNNVTGGIKPLGAGLFKIFATYTATGGNGTTAQLEICAADGSLSHFGDGVSGLYIYAAQMEVGSSPTSYIPTEASAVTRVADRTLVPITSAAGWFNPAEGSVVVSARQTVLSEATDRSIFALSDNSFANRVVLRGKYTGNHSGGFVVASTSVVQATINTGIVDDRQLQKFAASFAPNSFALAVSGGLKGQDTDGVVPAGITQLVIGGGQVVGNEIINGHIANLAYYPRRLTNAELQRLTA